MPATRNSRHSPTPSPSPPSRKPKVEPSVSAPENPSPRRQDQRVRQEWTEEEEAIWHEMVIKVLRKDLLPALRADGRLKGRSLKSHLTAYVNKLNKLCSREEC